MFCESAGSSHKNPAVFEIPHSPNMPLPIASPEIPHSPITPSASEIPHSRKIKPVRNSWHRTEIYQSHGVKYCRYRWGRGKDSWGYLHISGGSCTSELVQERRRAVDGAIASGATPEQIRKMMLPWGAARPGRKPAVVG